MLEIMSAIGYDAAVVGNHDFLNGPSELANTIERASPAFPVLGENKNLSGISAAEQLRVAKDLQPYVILNVAGVKVAVIGVLCDDFFYYGFFKPGGRHRPRDDSATAIAEQLHNSKQADVIVLLSHNADRAQRRLGAKHSLGECRDQRPYARQDASADRHDQWRQSGLHRRDQAVGPVSGRHDVDGHAFDGAGRAQELHAPPRVFGSGRRPDRRVDDHESGHAARVQVRVSKDIVHDAPVIATGRAGPR